MSDTERMTRDEIERRYPGQYVVVVGPAWLDPSSDDFTSARVVAVGQAWDEAIERARPLLAACDRWVCGFVGERQLVLQPLAPLALGYVSGFAHAGEGGAADRLARPAGGEAPGGRERLTWPQIRGRYPDRWVVMADHDLQEHDVAAWTTARVLAHGTTRGEAVGRAREALKAYSFYGCRYTGKLRGARAERGQGAHLGLAP